MTTKQSKKIMLFTFVNTGKGYAKQPITLFELITRLSDKTADVPGNRNNKTHSRK